MISRSMPVLMEMARVEAEVSTLDAGTFLPTSSGLDTRMGSCPEIAKSNRIGMAVALCWEII
jgi:hypothetical protein